MSTKLKCLLLDDELPGLAYLRTLCIEMPDVEVIKVFSDPARFLQEAPNLDFDFFVSDIHMPGHSGLDLVRSFPNKPVIFTTAYKEFAAEAFELDAVDYIVKPVRKERFAKAIQKVRQLLASVTPAVEPIVLTSSKGKIRLEVKSIALIRSSEIDRRDKTLFFTSGEEVLLKNISFHQLEQLLPETQFSRINKKEIIAIAAVKYYTQETVSLLINNTEMLLSLSPAYKAGLIGMMRS